MPFGEMGPDVGEGASGVDCTACVQWRRRTPEGTYGNQR